MQLLPPCTVPRPHTGVCSGGCFSPQLPLGPTWAVSYLQALQMPLTFHLVDLILPLK